MIPADFTLTDYILLGILGFSTLVSLARGFVREALSLFALVLAFVSAFYFAPDAADILSKRITNPQISYCVGFVILFFASWIIAAVINGFLGQVLSKVGISPIDRLLGMIFGLVRGILLVVFFLIIVQALYGSHGVWKKGEAERDLWADSKVVTYFHPLVNWMYENIPYLHEQAS